MGDFLTKERHCSIHFCNLGPCFHLWTPENFEIIFRNDSEFRIGMGIMAIVAKCFPEVKIITFELMTNHLHIMAACEESELRVMFEMVKKHLMKMTESADRVLNWTDFKPGIRKIESLSDSRNVLIYDNRNGFLVHDDYTPFSYPWGSNSCYFNPDAKKRYSESAVLSTIKERRYISHSHVSDGLSGLKILDRYFSPFSFCDVEAGEKLFRDAAHYFYMLGKNIEQNKEIAKEIGESVSYTDDELYSAICVKCREIYGVAIPSLISAEAKVSIAKVMRNDYNATTKQICRILRMDAIVLQSIFGRVE